MKESVRNRKMEFMKKNIQKNKKKTREREGFQNGVKQNWSLKNKGKQNLTKKEQNKHLNNRKEQNENQ